jgi:hypothetical protein
MRYYTLINTFFRVWLLCNFRSISSFFPVSFDLHEFLEFVEVVFFVYIAYFTVTRQASLSNQNLWVLSVVHFTQSYKIQLFYVNFLKISALDTEMCVEGETEIQKNLKFSFEILNFPEFQFLLQRIHILIILEKILRCRSF